MSDTRIPSPSSLLRAYGLPAKKRLGQNFLTDERILDRICAHALVTPGTRVLEIGPGPGGLTSRLLAAGADVLALEMDPDAVSFLERALVPLGPLEVRQGDALGPELSACLGEPPRTVVANLPYHVGTEILFRLIDAVSAPQLMVLMFQKEVAVRLACEGASREFGAPSVAVQLTYTASQVMTLPPGAFQPAPSVDSAVVVFRRRPQPLCDAETGKVVKRIASEAFQQRRKMLRRSLAGWGESMVQALELAQVPPTARPEELRVNEFVSVATHWRALTRPSASEG